VQQQTKMRSFSLYLLCTIVVVCNSAPVVTVVGRGLHVNGSPFTVKAVGYAPTPEGTDPTVTAPYGDYFTAQYSAFWKRDLPLIAKSGANAVKLWGWNNAQSHTAFLAEAVANNLFVIPTFFIGPSVYANLADPTTQAKVLSDFNSFLSDVGNNPAVLFYNLGSDLNADWNYGAEISSVFTVLNSLVARLKIVEIANPRPTSTAINDGNSIPTISIYDPTTLLDLWSVNVYRGCSFGALFSTFKAASSRPLFLSEFGIDAYNDLQQAVNQQQHANCFVSQWGEIMGNSSITIGGSVVEYVDEFWKGKQAQADARHPGCPNYNPAIQTNCGYTNNNFPDNYANSAYYGLVDSKFTPRLAYTALQKLWTNVTY